MDSDSALIRSVSMNLTLLNYSALRFFCQGELEWQLLEDSELDGQDDVNLSNHDMATAPLLTREAYVHTNRSGQADRKSVV